MADAPRQASLRRLREFDVRPNRELGQNFLIDDNILGVIGRAAELDAADVVLEVGGGLGVLSEYLAPRVAHLHVIEVDVSLEAALRDALGPYPNAELHLGDAVRIDFGRLDPSPGKVVANLPYGVAATVLLKSLAELPEAWLWVAMIQREVGERLAAAPASKSYGATSVLAQLAGEVRLLRPIPRTVFHPQPNVESALVLIRRTGPAPPPELVGARSRRVRPPPQDAVRIARARSRRGARHPGRHPRGAGRNRPPCRRPGRTPGAGGLAAAGRGDRPRAPRAAAAALSSGPSGPRSLLAVLLHEQAPAKLNLVLHVGRPRRDGLHPLCSLFASIDLVDEVEAEPAGGDADTRRLPGRGRQEPRAGRHRGVPPPRRAGAAAPRRPHREANPRRGRTRRGKRRRRRGAAYRQPRGGRARRRRAACMKWRRRLGSDVPSQIHPGHALVQGVGEIVEAVLLPPLSAVLVPDARGALHRGRVRRVRSSRRRARASRPRAHPGTRPPGRRQSRPPR